MMQRTYAVFGLMEYTINVKLGSRLLKIPFTGGIASKDGVRPATYTTSNPVVQFAIESSNHFKSGRVKTVKTIGEAAPDAPSVSEAKAAREKAAAAEAKAAEAKETKEATVQAEPSTTEDSDTETATDKGEDADGATEAAAEAKAAETTTIKVSCFADARQYLIDNCGCKATSLKSKKAVAEYAEQHNIVFEWPEE